MAFYNLFSKKTGQTLTKSKSLTLYKFPTLLKILYSPAIWQLSLQLGRSVFQFFVITQTILPIVKSGSRLCLFTCCFINFYAFIKFIQATVQASSKCLVYCQTSLQDSFSHTVQDPFNLFQSKLIQGKQPIFN